MRLGIDLDGVVYPFVEQFTKYAEMRLGRSLPEVKQWNFPVEQWGLTVERFIELMADGANEGFLWWEGQPEFGAREVLLKLRDLGHKIIFVTDRAPKGGEWQAKVATITWLHDHGFEYDGLFVVRDKTGLGLDLLIDDGPHNIERADAAGEMAVVFDRPWNRDVETGRVYSWSDVQTWVTHYASFLNRDVA